METFSAWRHAAYDTPVRTMPSRRTGRYNTAASPPTQYLCLHPWGPWAELLRWEDRRTEQDVLDVRSRVWALRVQAQGPVLHVDFANAQDHGLRPEDLVDEDYRACQELSQRARAEGAVALVVPSAALPGTQNLVVLGARVASSWSSTPIDETDVPAAVVSDRGGPPLALLAHVRWRRASHAGLLAWRGGDPGPVVETVPAAL